MTSHVHEPLPGSVWDADGTWRPTAEQAAGKEPFRAVCRACGYLITRTHESEWEVASLTEMQEQVVSKAASVVPDREYEPGYDAERELQDWTNELRRDRVGEFDVDLSPASPGPAWEWPVNDLGGQDPHPSGGTDENDLDEEV